MPSVIDHQGSAIALCQLISAHFFKDYSTGWSIDPGGLPGFVYLPY
jgi:hypothetical protein